MRVFRLDSMDDGVDCYWALHVQLIYRFEWECCRQKMNYWERNKTKRNIGVKFKQIKWNKCGIKGEETCKRQKDRHTQDKTGQNRKMRVMNLSYIGFLKIPQHKKHSFSRTTHKRPHISTGWRKHWLDCLALSSYFGCWRFATKCFS